MKKLLFRTLLTATTIGFCIAGPAAATSAHPQEKHRAEAPYHAPRAPDGHPDLSGVWQVLNTAGDDVEPHIARGAYAMRPGPLGPVPAREVVALGAVGVVPAGDGVVEGGFIPYKPEALAKRNENREHWLERDPEIKCYQPGVPRANYMNHAFQIIQNRKTIMLAYEYAGAVRDILMNHTGAAPLDSWMGQSSGRWEGDTLVVTVTGLLDSSWLDRAGNHHSDQLKVVERYTPVAPGVMRYEAELTDPETYTRPWKMSMYLYKKYGRDAKLQELHCVDLVEELMYGSLRKNPLK